MLTRPLRALFVLAALYFLYLFNLTAMGVVSADEPRYSSVGRAMALTGDWITPRLWGQPWFEKPALLYWMTAAGFRAGLSEDLAPRLPVALLSVAFLLFYGWILRREFGWRAAIYATAILATSAGWLAYSHVAVTDLPLAATFSAAMLLSLPWIRTRDRRWLTPAAAMLALAVLAKGLVPFVLALPIMWSGRRQLRDLAAPAALFTFAAIAVPWYTLCTLRNGTPFLRTFFLEHHFARFTSNALQHGQPFWYYAPIFLAALFPWTPLVVLLFARDQYRDPRVLFLLLWVVFGFVFFSAATNKLPGYLLPLLPAATAIAGIALSKVRSAGPALLATSLLLSITPTVAAILPQALAAGSFQFLGMYRFPFVFLATFAAGLAAWYLDRHSRREAAFGVVLGLTVISAVYMNAAALPAIDRAASARPLWREVRQRKAPICVGAVNRNWRYGLNYYSITPLPDCAGIAAATAIEPGQPRPVILSR